MPGVGHILVGCAAGRLFAGRRPTAVKLGGSMLAFAALSSAADLDVVAFALGIPYDAPWGHRGAVHSLAVGLALGLVFALAARILGRPFLRTVALACLVGVSHPLFDTLTDGGKGIALLWPFSDERLFAPWRPIPVAPIGPSALSARGWVVVRAELLMFSPLLLYAFVPRWWRRQPPGKDQESETSPGSSRINSAI